MAGSGRLAQLCRADGRNASVGAGPRGRIANGPAVPEGATGPLDPHSDLQLTEQQEQRGNGEHGDEERPDEQGNKQAVVVLEVHVVRHNNRELDR